MTTTFDTEPGGGLAREQLPPYTEMQHAYHRSRQPELRQIVGALPLGPGSHVLDVASGDGCLSMLLAERAARVVSVDLSPALLAEAQGRAARAPHGQRVSFQLAEAGRLAFPDGAFDLAWCAQSMFSLPDPLAAVREMLRVVHPGGHVAVLENDSLHHMVLPWPAELELAVRAAQHAALASRSPSQATAKFYIGRDLGGLLAQAGAVDVRVLPFAVQRRAPLAADEERYLATHLAELGALIAPHLAPEATRAFDMLTRPSSPLFMLRQPSFQITHIELLAVGLRAG
ncbi:methyltransferase domain-containing protein [Chloroflexia bacterium SDU3-3]|nr:methyltransferase domain-containing protein [Chloroflexia bacterium SDU3-3]